MNRLHNLPLSRKLLLVFPTILLLGLAALQVTNTLLSRRVERTVIFPNMEEIMSADVRLMLKALVDAEAVSLGRRAEALPTAAEKNAALVAETDSVRFFKDRSGYFFLYDLDGTRINVPTNKKDNGKNLIGLTDPHGVPFVRQLGDRAREGGGFVTYSFEKPGSGVQPKLAYATLVPGTTMFVGTGVYIDNVETERARLHARIEAQQSQYDMVIAGVFAVILILALISTVWFSRSLTASVRTAVHDLLSGADQVAAAANQLSEQSQGFAAAASEQAAQVDHATAALAGIEGGAARNSENASKVKAAAGQAEQVADRGASDMLEMRRAIDAIRESSGDIAKIIKVIDGIAFQTNILALNAAVEAARAGAAGMGFAVVADEVRKLAQRSAEAAQETTAKIQGAVNNTAAGVQVSGRVASALDDIVSRVSEMTALIDAVAAASGDQSEGVQQIHLAVGEMNKVTQTCAANAEESAAAAQELSAQAASMRHSVLALSALVDRRR